MRRLNCLSDLSISHIYTLSGLNSILSFITTQHCHSLACIMYSLVLHTLMPVANVTNEKFNRLSTYMPSI